MARSMTLNVRVQGPLGEFVASNVGEGGMYENVSEYIRDLIRKDRDRSEREQLDRLKSELQVAFAAPEDGYSSLTAEAVIARNRNPEAA